jgi:hypothetical protein
MSLAEIKKTLQFSTGSHPPDSILYANELVRGMGREARAYLPGPLSVVFVGLNRWQLE